MVPPGWRTRSGWQSWSSVNSEERLNAACSGLAPCAAAALGREQTRRRDPAVDKRTTFRPCLDSIGALANARSSGDPRVPRDEAFRRFVNAYFPPVWRLRVLDNELAVADMMTSW